MLGIWAGGAAILMAAAVIAVVWVARAAASWRLRAAANAYAEREIARTRWHGPSPQPGPFRATAGDASNHRVS
jgi:hypothetical protein